MRSRASRAHVAKSILRSACRVSTADISAYDRSDIVECKQTVKSFYQRGRVTVWSGLSPDPQLSGIYVRVT